MRQTRIVQSPMGLRLESQAELVHQVLQTVTPGMGHENARQGESVNAGIGAQHLLFAQESRVEADVVADEGVITHEGAQFLRHLADGRRARHIRIGNPRQLRDELRNAAAGVHKSREALDLTRAAETQGPHFDHGIMLGIQAGGLQIQGDVGLCHKLLQKNRNQRVSSQRISEKANRRITYVHTFSASNQRRRMIGR